MTISSKRAIEKCQPWNERKTGGRSATVPHHTRLFCNLRQVHPYGETTCLLRTHAYCKTHAYYDMSYHNVKLVSYYKITVYKRWVWWGTVADRPPLIFQWLLLEMVIWMEMTPDFSLIPRLTIDFSMALAWDGHLDGNDPRFFVNSKVDHWFFNGSCLRWSFGWKFFFFQYNKDVRPYFTLSKWSTRKKLVEVFIFQT